MAPVSASIAKRTTTISFIAVATGGGQALLIGSFLPIRLNVRTGDSQEVPTMPGAKSGGALQFRDQSSSSGARMRGLALASPTGPDSAGLSFWAALERCGYPVNIPIIVPGPIYDLPPVTKAGAIVLERGTRSRNRASPN